MASKTKAQLAELQKEADAVDEFLREHPEPARDRYRGQKVGPKYLDDIWRHLEAIDKADPFSVHVSVRAAFAALKGRKTDLPRGAANLYCGAGEIIKSLAVTVDTLQAEIAALKAAP